MDGALGDVGDAWLVQERFVQRRLFVLAVILWQFSQLSLNLFDSRNHVFHLGRIEFAEFVFGDADGWAFAPQVGEEFVSSKFVLRLETD